MFCPLGNASSQRLRGSSSGGRVALSLVPRHVQGAVGQDPHAARQIVIPTRSQTRTRAGFSLSAGPGNFVSQQRHVVVAPGYGLGPGPAKPSAQSVSPTRSPHRFEPPPGAASPAPPVVRREVSPPASGTARAGEVSTMYVARVARGRAATAMERSRSCDMSQGGSISTARTPRTPAGSAGKAGRVSGSGSVRNGWKEKIQPRNQLSTTRKAIDSRPLSAGAEQVKQPPERGLGTSPQRRAGEVTGRKPEVSREVEKQSVFKWQGPDDLCRHEIQVAVQQATAHCCQAFAGHDEATGGESPKGLPPPQSPAPSTVDMRGSLGNPSPLSGGGAWELSDSSHHSLNISTNSSSQEEDSPGGNDAPPEYLVPTPRRFDVNAFAAGSDPLTRTMKTVSTMRSFWESKVRENAGSKDGEREARWSRVSNVESRKNAQGPTWLKKELTKLQAHVDANKERLLELSLRLHGQDDAALDDEHSTRCSRSPSSKSSCTISSDSDFSKSQDAQEDDELHTSLKSLRRDFSKVNRKTAALFEEVLERCLPKEKLRMHEDSLGQVPSLHVTF